MWRIFVPKNTIIDLVMGFSRMGLDLKLGAPNE